MDLDLQGFSFQNFTALDSDQRSNIALRSSDWWVRWLARDKEFTPQPYQQLAATLKQAGQVDKSNDVLYAQKRREFDEAWRHWHFFEFVSLGSQWLFIGFGIGYLLLLHSLFWVFFFVLLGVFVMRRYGQTALSLPKYPIAYSFDMLLPLVKLRDDHYKIPLYGPARTYFYFHKIIGFLLASFVVAGLTGLTKN